MDIINSVEFENIKLNLASILLFSIWDDKTKEELDTYMKLIGVPYLTNNVYLDNDFWIVVKLNGIMYKFNIDSEKIELA